MQLNFNLKMNQQQKLTITQSMKQSLNILQMSTYELRQYINEAFLENPLLDGEFSFVNSKEREIDELTYNKMIKMSEFDSYTSNMSYDSYTSDNDDDSPYKFISEKKTLKDYLSDQLNEIVLSKKIKAVVKYLIEDLDERGYLVEDLNFVCKELKIRKEDGQAALKIIQSLEPAGIGARDLKECLKIQLERKNILDSNLNNILLYYLEFIAENKYKYIAKKLNISDKEAQYYGDIIKSLEPKPSRGFFTGEDLKFIIPDAYIIKGKDGFEIKLNTNALPRISLNKYYSDILINNKDDSKYIKEKAKEASILIKNIAERKNTLYSILEYIVMKQQSFFKKGPGHLRKMTLQEVADSIGFSISTVSRAVKEKYISTDFGTVSIRSLFTMGDISDEFEDKSLGIKYKIKILIDEEKKENPLSDQAICDELNKSNLNISRRTVAKYREEMGIKSSAKRKRI